MINKLTRSNDFNTTWTPYPFTEEQFYVGGLKLHLGPNDTYLNDFINVDIDNPIADISGDAMNLSMFNDNTISLILASHLIEHFSNTDAEKALKEWYRVLKPGCWLVMELPDMEKCFRMYLDSKDLKVKKDAGIGVWGRFDWIIFQGHRYGYDRQTIEDVLIRVGFEDITFLEPLDNSATTRSMRVDARKGSSNV